MSNNERYCSFCGNVILPNSKFCNACGAAVEIFEQNQATSYTYTTQTSQSSSMQEAQILGAVSIYLGIICCLIIPLLGNIVGVVLGHLSQKKGKNKFATASLALNYSLIGFFVLLALVLTLVFTL